MTDDAIAEYVKEQQKILNQSWAHLQAWDGGCNRAVIDDKKYALLRSLRLDETAA